MKVAIIYAIFTYLIYCADNVGDDKHSLEQRLVRAAFWPLTMHQWLTTHSIRLNRLLTSLWIFLISGWAVTLLLDRLPG